MKRLTLFLILLSAFSSPLPAGDTKPAPAQPPATTGKTTDATDEKEPPAPQTLEEAHAWMQKQLSKKDLAKIDAMKSEDDMIEYHFSISLYMRNNWGFWGGGPLADHMKKLGFNHPDDMSGVILDTFWCKRHQQDLRLKERAEYYDTYWKSAARPPATLKDPKVGSEIEWRWSRGAPSKEGVKSPRTIHLGRSLKTGRYLAYEFDKGMYEPDEATLEWLGVKATSDAKDSSDPFAPPPYIEKVQDQKNK